MLHTTRHDYGKDMNYELMQGDCLELMKSLPDASVDLILCDLPYGTTQCKWDIVLPFELLWAAYRRIIKPAGSIVLTASQPFTSALGASNLSWLRYSWVWEKARPTDFLNAKKKPLKGFEDVLVFAPRLGVYNPQDTISIDRTVSNTGTKAGGRNGRKENDDQSFHGGLKGETYRQTVTGYPRGIVRFAQDASALHPTQKPVALMEYLVRTYTNEGDVVLDNCMGSGTTGVACMNTGRRFIGMELDEGYFQISQKRIEEAAFKYANDNDEEYLRFIEDIIGTPAKAHPTRR